MKAFWGHSLATGIACQELAHFAQIASEELFTIGLLSRVGELAHGFTLYPDEYAVHPDQVPGKRSRKSPRSKSQRFAMDHHEFGATMLNEWGSAG
jgi:HD-like signal output (HDOD) protein